MLAASYRLESVSAVAEEVLPTLAAAMQANFLFLHHGSSSDAATVVTWPPADDVLDSYQQDYAADCPFEIVKSKSRDRVLPLTRRVPRKSLLRSSFYADLLRPAGLEHHVQLRLDPCESDPSMPKTGIMICRDRRAGEFSDDDLRLLGALQPSLLQSCKRADELDRLRQKTDALEAILSMGGAGALRLAVDADGREVHLHGSTSALDTAVLSVIRDASHPLRLLARDVARGRHTPAGLEATLSPVLGLDGSSYIPEVTRLPHAIGTRTMALLTLTPTGTPSRPWKNWGLSRTEVTVLREIVEGRSNAEIGRRLFISPETVRTHLTRIYRKMGVRSRLEAAAVARPS